MRRCGWHLQRCGAVLTLSRRRPARFDVAARTRLPRLRAGVLAHEIRKDLWRELRGLRGFLPVVEVTDAGDALWVRAGGQAAGPVPAGTAARIAAVLEDAGRRARWCAHARKRVVSDPARERVVFAPVDPARKRSILDPVQPGPGAEARG